MATLIKLNEFERQNEIRYFSGDERRQEGLGPLDTRVGTGICPYCNEPAMIANDFGLLGKMAGPNQWHGSNYFENHYPDGRKRCLGSETSFNQMVDKGSQ